MKTNQIIFFSFFMIMLSIFGFILPVRATSGVVVKFAATPTPKAALKSVTFDLDTAKTVPPSDILNQISFTGRGGGEGCKSKSYPTPIIVDQAKSTTDLMDSIFLVTCGWEANEQLIGHVTFPNGKRQTVPVEMYTSNTGVYVGVANFAPFITDPTGTYKLTITGRSTTLEVVSKFRMPEKPTIYKLDASRILLYGFSPSESVRLFYYATELKGWQEYTMGTDGRLEVKTSLRGIKGGVFIVVGKKTGEVRMHDLIGINESTVILNGEVYCDQGLISRVRVGGNAKASYTDGTKLRIRVQPGFGNEVSHSVLEGTKMKIVGGPKCVGGSTWWKVEISGGITGWVAEYWHGSEYLIEPVR